MNKYEVSSIVAINLMAPVVAGVSIPWLLGENMSWKKIIGGLIDLFCVAVIQIHWNQIARPVK
jgi:drug/metabolite transporter (DMT)-like permease